ncbi:LPS translocon maturation chaperone LptM [Shewanella olleyana]|uniref:LPS translocon maturation chaperone LptM n=1 Tax=Shewanella olleyana TaxID=135626 RepID=UPI003D1618E7
MRLFLLVMLASLFVIGCGQQGPLYKSPDVETNQEERKSQEPTSEQTQQEAQEQSQEST